jgi:hypothetical protein
MKKNTAQFIDFFASFRTPQDVEDSAIPAISDAWAAHMKEHGGVGIRDPANVAMLWTDNQRLAAIMQSLYPDERPQKLPDLKYADRPGGAKYSAEYLKLVFKALSSIDTEIAPHIITGGDFPLTVTWTFSNNTHVKFILAPRVDND